MSFLSKWFSGETRRGGPNMRFGRYSDAYKPDAKYLAWDRALDLFEEKDYMASFTAFFDYLLDDNQHNLRTWKDNDTLRFELLQGSKLITGAIDDRIIHAEAKVAKARSLPIGFLRRMMEQNYMLKYSRYALDQEDNLTLLFDSYLLDGSPYKLYYALKEIAISADKQDDLLVEEFDSLESINTGHVQELSPDEQRVKTAFIRQKINSVFETIDQGSLSQDHYTGGIGYLLLDLNYRLDYLISPEGRLTETFERIHRTYFSSDEKSPAEKNAIVRKEFEKILELTDDEIGKELYEVTSSFGITSPGGHEQLVNSIEGELPNMDWFVENKHEKIAMAIPGYIAGYGLFNYAFPPPLHDLLHVYFWITEPDFFRQLGFTPDFYSGEPRQLNKRRIRHAIKEIREKYRTRYPKFEPGSRNLDYHNLVFFAKSYFTMLKELDLTKTN